MPPLRTDRSADAALIERTRQGDRSAYAELWERHSASARTVARSYSSLDPDDLVAESFTKIYSKILAGGGPTGAFRPYLFTTIRNTAAGWGRARHETTLDTLESFEDPASSESATLEALDRGATAQAFRSLPTRWQEVLWYSEVENMTPQQIAPLLGMSANSAAALAYRAREGLRQAWIRVHLRNPANAPECQWTIDRLGSYTRGKLRVRETTRLETHLDECARCTIVAAEARDVGSRLALVLLPLTAGIGGATAYSAWLSQGAPVADLALGAAGMPAVVTGLHSAGSSGAAGASTGASGTAGGAGAGSGAAGTAAGTTAGASTAGGLVGAVGGAGVIIGAGVGTLVLAAAAVAAVIIVPTLAAAPPPPETSVVAEPLPDTTETEVPDVAAPVPLPIVPPIAPPNPVAPPVDVESEEVVAAPSPAPNPDPTPPTTPTPTTPTTPPDPEPVDTEALPPVIGNVDTADGLVAPIISGTAEPGATIDVTIAGVSDTAPAVSAFTSDATAVVVADEQGFWTFAPTGLSAGAYSLSARQTDVAQNISDASEPIDFHLEAPTLEVYTAGPFILAIADGRPNTDVLVTSSRFGSHTITLDREGRKSILGLGRIEDGDTITVQYAANGRLGAQNTAVVNRWGSPEVDATMMPEATALPG